ncbi:MAG TPA: hypothetical protein ENG42_01740 [Candidatus Aenigmarchaeota archaeon]|nr:MAG: hypothetical protein DRP03_00165 [Candidatus Aenigmarchaeota archaeon]HDD46171.1 hypothetical protein [Candidatus Aenigmarchaeota archaeon]
MLRGYADAKVIISTIIFVTASILLSMYFVEHFIKLEGRIKMPTEGVDAFKIAHSIKHCLQQLGNGSISSAVLDTISEKDIVEKCMLPQPLTITITDLENGKQWKFGIGDEFLREVVEVKREIKKHSSYSWHEIFVPIEYKDVVASDDILFEKNRSYMLSIYSKNNNLFLKIKRIEAGNASTFVIRNSDDVERFKEYIDGIYKSGGNASVYLFTRANIMKNTLAVLKFAKSMNECKNKRNRICIVVEREVHVGRLYVKI